MDGWEAGWRWVAAWVVVLSVGLRPTSLALVGLRPKPRAGAMLDSDMPSDVLVCCL
jgi:hypothetical protein